MSMLCFVCYFVYVSAYYVLLISHRTHGAQFRINSHCAQPRGDYCVLIYDCPYFSDLLKQFTPPLPRSVIDIIRRKQCGFQNNKPKVCCDNEEVDATKLQYSSSLREPDFTEITNHPNMHLLHDDCGKLSVKFRITQGDDAELLEFPWMALLSFYSKGKIDFKCGGTVINKRYVLTAAHCATSSELVGVRLGEYNLRTHYDCNQMSDYCAPPVQDFYIQDIIIHPDYTTENRLWLNDIALIRLATPVTFGYENVQPICLPVYESVANVNLNGKYLTVSGWGVKENGEKSEVLQKVKIPVLPYGYCAELYKNYTTITFKQICAGGEIGKDSCSGDSGGPLKYASIIDDSLRYVQYGIVSYGPTICGMKPAIYTNIVYYTKWILDNLKP